MNHKRRQRHAEDVRALALVLLGILVLSTPAQAAIAFFGTAMVKPSIYANFDLNDSTNDVPMGHEANLTKGELMLPVLGLVENRGYFPSIILGQKHQGDMIPGGKPDSHRQPGSICDRFYAAKGANTIIHVLRGNKSRESGDKS